MQAAHVLGQAVGFRAGDGRAGRRGSGGPLPRDFDSGPQKIDLFAVNVLHVILFETLNIQERLKGDLLQSRTRGSMRRRESSSCDPSSAVSALKNKGALICLVLVASSLH